MPRKPRLHYPGAVYHVILRGNAKQDIFFDVEDRHRFLAIIQECIERFEFRIHGYCLMTNHIHLALQVGEVSLSRIMQNLSLRYTKWINWRHDRIGHLFHGRFKAVLVEADAYLSQLVAYLHLNPVRARMTKAPEEYRWSSHQAYLGLDQCQWLTTEFVLSQFSSRESKARTAFQEFVACSDEGHRPEFHGVNLTDSRVFGDDTFVQDVLGNAPNSSTVPTIDDLLTAVQEVCEVTAEEMAAPGQGIRISEARALAAWGVRSFTNSTLTELAGRLGRDTTSLCSAAKRLEARSKDDGVVAGRMEAVKKVSEKFATLQS